MNFQDYAHISDEEIAQDIADTESEIAKMQMDVTYFESTPQHSVERKWNHIRASARRTGIAEREAFVGKLRAIQNFRAAKTLASGGATQNQPPTPPVSGTAGVSK